MGFFDKEPIDLSVPGEVTVAPHVAEAVPDAGRHLYEWVRDLLNDDSADRLAREIDARRHPNGWLTVEGLADAPPLGRHENIMTYLRTLVGGEAAIAVSVWGTFPGRGRDLKHLSGTLNELVKTQGHAAAATWAIGARPQQRLSVDSLSPMLHTAWDHSLGFRRNKDVIKAIRNWH